MSNLPANLPGGPNQEPSRPREIITRVVPDTRELLQRSGGLEAGTGTITTVVALSLAIPSALAVLSFHFPQYLTTPELRQHYSVDILRKVLFAALSIAGALSAINVFRGRRRAVNVAAFSLVVIAVIFGGSGVPVGDFPDHTPYVGLDWFILDLLKSIVIFTVLEKIFPLYKDQALFRAEWQTDLTHFGVNHFIVGLVLLVVNFILRHVFGWAMSNTVAHTVSSIPYLPQVLLCILVADLAQYWTHRAYHEVPILWKLHSVHHSAKTMDWLAGSRQHLIELTITRVAVLAPLYLLGFSEATMDTYILVVGFQAVFNHSNIALPWGPLRYVIVTPDFHHWHHASDDEAIDKNYAAHYAFLDYLFGTAVKSRQHFPEKYGVVGDYMPDGFLAQQAFPFKGHTQPKLSSDP